MNILFVTPPPYLPNRLHRNRAFELIKILSKKHNVHLLAITTEHKVPQEFEELKKYCSSVTVIRQNKFLSMINCIRLPYLPYEVSYCSNEKVPLLITKLVKKHRISLIYLKRLRSAIYLRRFWTPIKILTNFKGKSQNDKAFNIPVILDTTDAMSLFYFRMFDNASFPKNIFYLFEALKYRSFEKATMEKVQQWVVSSENDAQYLKSFAIADITTIPNPVDLSFYSKKYLDPRFYGDDNKKHSLIFRGLMDKKVNTDAAIYFVNTIFPLIKKSVPDITLLIVGPKPTGEIKKLAGVKNIVVTGFIDDISELMAKTEIVICPVRIGTGTRFKILQAWAMQKPVVSTTIGASGLMYKDEENILIGDTPKQFAKQVIKLFENKKLQKEIAENGYETAKKYYSTNTIERQLNKLLDRHSGKAASNRTHPESILDKPE